MLPRPFWNWVASKVVALCDQDMWFEVDLKMASSACILSTWCVQKPSKSTDLIFGPTQLETAGLRTSWKTRSVRSQVGWRCSACAFYWSVYNSKLQVFDGGCNVLLQVRCNATTQIRFLNKRPPTTCSFVIYQVKQDFIFFHLHLLLQVYPKRYEMAKQTAESSLL